MKLTDRKTRNRKRRGRGEGSICQRADGLWVTSVSDGYDGAGKRRRTTLYGKTKNEVQQKLADFRQRMTRGSVLNAADLTVEAFLAHWLTAIKGSVSAGTHAYYESHARRHITSRLGRTKLRAVSAATVLSFYSGMAADGATDSLRSKVGTTLGIALGEAVRLQLIPANPARDVRKPRPAKKEMSALTADQFRTFLAAAQVDRLGPLYAVALDSGARQGELFGLQWQDVDFAAACLHIRRSLRVIKGVLSIGPPKTAQSRRRVDLSRFALDALAEHRTRMLADGHCRPDGPVFCDTRGNYLRKGNVLRRSFRPLLKRAGLPPIRFHDLRHTVASLLLSDGESVKVVGERLGHANAAMTLNIYAHVAPGAQAKAAARLDALYRAVNPDRETA